MSHQVSRDEALDRIEDLEATVNDLVTRLEAASTKREDLQGQIWELRDETEELRDENDDLREENEALQDRVDELEGVEARLRKERAKLTRRVANVEDELGLEDEDVIALAEGGQDAVRESDLARLLEGGADAVKHNPTATYYRAEVLARNWIRWGRTKTQSGAVVERTLATQRDDLRTRLEDARGESLEWRQVYRAMQKVAELGPPNFYLTEDRHGKTLVQTVDGGDSDR